MFVNQTNKTYRLALELSRLIIFLKVVDIISAKIIDRRLSLDAQARFPDVPLKSLVIRVRRGDQKPGTEQNQNPHFGMKKKLKCHYFTAVPLNVALLSPRTTKSTLECLGAFSVNLFASDFRLLKIRKKQTSD